MSFAYLLAYTATFSVLIPIVYCFWARKKKDKVINTLWILLCIDLAIAIISRIYVHSGESSALYFNIYPLFQFILISIVYTYLIPHWKKWIYGLIPIYVLFFIANALCIEDIRIIQSYPLFAQSIIFTSYSGLHYWHIRSTIEKEPPLFSYGPFWINTAFALYFFCSMVLFVMANHILTELESAASRMIWSVHALNYLAKTILLTVGIRHIHKAEDKEFDYKLFREDEHWQKRMKPNPHLDNQEDGVTEK